MSKLRFHRLAAFVVLIAAGAWVATGEFSSVGSAANEPEAQTPEGAAAPVSVEAEAPRRTVGVSEPEFFQHNRIVRISGVTEADKKTTLATRSAGVIAELAVKKGDWVETGDVVLSLEGAEKESALETAKALLQQRQNEAENVERLISRGIAPKTQADDARSALAQARSQVEAAQAEIDRLQVIAPFSGVVDSVAVEEASWAPTGTEVAVLLSLDPVIVRGEVSERERGLIKVGGEAEIRLISGTEAKGTVRYVSREATSATRTFPVEVAIPNPDNEIPAGMTAEIMLKAAPVKAVRLPRSVVTLDADGNLGVRTVSTDDTVGFVPIDLIDDTPEGLILAGVPEDARIIVAGQDLVGEGDKVNVAEAGQGIAAVRTGAVQ